MAKKTFSPAKGPATTDEAAKSARLPENVHARTAALAAAIRVRKARDLAEGRKHKGRTRAVLVRS